MTQPAAAPVTTITVDNGELRIDAARDSDLHRVLRRSGTPTRWDATNRTWAVPVQAWPVVAGWCAANGVDYPVPPTLTQTEKVTYQRVGNYFRVLTPSSDSKVGTELLAAPWATGHLADESIEWTVHVRFAAYLAAIVARYDHGAITGLVGVTPPWQRQARTNIDHSSLTALPAGVQAPSVTGLTSTLMAEQFVSLHMLMTNGSLINADEQGLGKTLQGLSAARIVGHEAQRLLIVCPSNLAGNWIAEMAEHFTEGTFTPYLAHGRTADPIPDSADAVIVGWPNLPFWTETLIDWSPDLAVFDEAHYAKNISLSDGEEGTQRGQAFLDVCTHVARNGRVCALSGTPVTNRPVEMLPLLEATGAIAYYGGRKNYLDRYCAPKQTPRGTLYKGNSNTDELNRLLRASGHYLRRTKEHLVANGTLKPKYVDGARFYSGDPESPIMIKGDPLAMGRYVRARADIIEFLISEIRKTNPNASGDYIRRKLSSPRAKEFSELAKLRKLAAEAKAPYVMSLTDALIAKGEKVVLAAHHREIVDLFAERYGDCRIQGGMSLKKVEEAKHRFNTRPVSECPVLVLSTEAGKTGHTLCKQPQYPDAGPACAHMIIVEQGWVPGDEAQTQDRIWRIGQPREVRIANVLVEDTTDTMIYGVRKKKQAVVSEVTDGIASEKEMTGLVFASLYDQVMGS